MAYLPVRSCLARGVVFSTSRVARVRTDRAADARKRGLTRDVDGVETYLAEAYLPRTSAGGPRAAAARARACKTDEQ